MRYGKYHTNQAARHLVLLVTSALAIVLALAACAPTRSDDLTSGRPACVSLSSYSGVILQVMGVQPEWAPTVYVDEGYETQWLIQDDRGSHALSATLTSEGCVCATNATSKFHGGSARGELAGLLQGAAVAPVSDLGYTGKWLEPKILLQCTFAFLLRKTYEAETTMPDETTWRLVCSRNPSEANGELVTSLTVVSPNCLNAFD